MDLLDYFEAPESWMDSLYKPGGWGNRVLQNTIEMLPPAANALGFPEQMSAREQARLDGNVALSQDLATKPPGEFDGGAIRRALFGGSVDDADRAEAKRFVDWNKQSFYATPTYDRADRDVREPDQRKGIKEEVVDLDDVRRAREWGKSARADIGGAGWTESELADYVDEHGGLPMGHAFSQGDIDNNVRYNRYAYFNELLNNPEGVDGITPHSDRLGISRLAGVGRNTLDTLADRVIIDQDPHLYQNSMPFGGLFGETDSIFTPRNHHRTLEYINGGDHSTGDDVENLMDNPWTGGGWIQQWGSRGLHGGAFRGSGEYAWNAFQNDLDPLNIPANMHNAVAQNFGDIDSQDVEGTVGPDGLLDGLTHDQLNRTAANLHYLNNGPMIFPENADAKERHDMASKLYQARNDLMPPEISAHYTAQTGKHLSPKGAMAYHFMANASDPTTLVTVPFMGGAGYLAKTGRLAPSVSNLLLKPGIRSAASAAGSYATHVGADAAEDAARSPLFQVPIHGLQGGNELPPNYEWEQILPTGEEANPHSLNSMQMFRGTQEQAQDLVNETRERQSTGHNEVSDLVKELTKQQIKYGF